MISQSFETLPPATFTVMGSSLCEAFQVNDRVLDLSKLVLQLVTHWVIPETVAPTTVFATITFCLPHDPTPK